MNDDRLLLIENAPIQRHLCIVSILVEARNVDKYCGVLRLCLCICVAVGVNIHRRNEQPDKVITEATEKSLNVLLLII